MGSSNVKMDPVDNQEEQKCSIVRLLKTPASTQ